MKKEININKDIQTNWDLTLFYKNEQDPQIEKDLKKTERVYKAFVKKYGTNDAWLKSTKKLKEALDDYEKLSSMPSSKPLLYFWYIKELDGSRSDIAGRLQKYEECLQKVGLQLLFFELKLGKINVKKQKEFLKSPLFATYRYYLKQLFATAKYDLTEKEERVLSLTSSPRGGMWVDGVEKLINKQMISFEKGEIPINEALGKVSQIKNVKKRRKLRADIMQRLHEIADFPEAEINAVFTNKKTMDELRGFKQPYDSRILADETDKKAVLALVDVVSKNFAISQKFFKLKKELLGLETLTGADLFVPIGKTKKKYPFKDAYKLVREVFYNTGEKYGKEFDTMFNNGQIDVFPTKGRSGGGYHLSSDGVPTFILLNHTDDIHSVTALGHEMGHAMHSSNSKKQHALYNGYSTAVAETASTFFEGLTFDALVVEMTDKEKVIALHDKIQEDISTIFGQISFFNFELDLHTRVREEGFVSKEDISKLFIMHRKKLVGDVVDITENDGYAWTYISHFRRSFYVYTYAYGQLVSKALLGNYKKDRSFIKKVDQFLSAGGSDAPENIFKKIGIDIKKSEFWKAGIESIRKDVNRLEKLMKEMKK